MWEEVRHPSVDAWNALRDLILPTCPPIPRVGLGPSLSGFQADPPGNRKVWDSSQPFHEPRMAQEPELDIASLTWLALLSQIDKVVPPTAAIAAIMATMMSPSIMAYSMEVGPSSSRRNLWRYLFNMLDRPFRTAIVARAQERFH